MMTAVQLHTQSGTLTPCAPFDFAKTFAFLDEFTPTEGEQLLTPESVTKAITLAGRAIAFELQSEGTTEEPRLRYTLSSASPLTEADVAAAEDRMRFFLSLDDDLRPFYALARADAAFAPVIERFYGLHQPKFLTPFELACWAVLAQRQPLPVARRVKHALVARFGTSITIDDKTLWAFPEPAQLAATDPAELVAIVRHERKVASLRAVSAFFDGIDEQELRSGDIEEVEARLRSIRGIGEWSAAFLLVRGLGRMERASARDEALARAAAKVYGKPAPLSRAELQRHLDHYGATQGYWAYYCRTAERDH